MKKIILKNSLNNSNNSLEKLHNSKEIVSKRSLFTKQFSNEDGSYTLKIYSSPIHYFDNETKTIEEIDNTFTSLESTSKVKKNSMNLELQNELTPNKKLFTLENNHHQISVEYRGKIESGKTKICENAVRKLKSINKLINSVIYPDIGNNIDLEYCLENNHLKENIIIKNRSTDYIFEFAIDISDLKIKLDDSESYLELVDKNNKTHFCIPRPIMYDSEGNYSDDIIYEIEELAEGKLKFIIKADDKWINQNNRVFPVIIDPDFIITVDESSIMTHYSVANNYIELNQGTSSRIGKDNVSEYLHLISFKLTELNTFVIKEANLIFPIIHLYEPTIKISDYNENLLDYNIPRIVFEPSKLTNFNIFNDNTLTYDYIEDKRCAILNLTNIFKYWQNNNTEYGHLAIQDTKLNGVFSFSLPTLTIKYLVEEKKPSDYLELNQPIISVVSSSGDVKLAIDGRIFNGVLTSFNDFDSKKVYQHFQVNDLIFTRHSIDLNTWSFWRNNSLKATFENGNLYFNDRSED